jgi:Tol biopolymer transport system component/predicted Ser/Thr protein kinase
VIGRSIGPYEVVAKLGEGGMGQVYRARDPQLGRDVAIKVLPPAFAADADRLARFEREARVLAALNHPNIAAIYGVEARALVMELVEGETLEVLIARSRPHGLGLEEALPIARQIAVALEAAHAAGVVHRDLKPANIKVRTDGVVKILDFGLAKALEGDTPAGGSSPADSPTLTARGTRLGTILGTAAYMAPEQARGKVVDKRADLWAFGCVFFEMLTGRPAFTGETVTDILAAVVRAEPALQSLPARTPQPIQTLLRRCLTKDPGDRLGDASTARLEIDDARTAPAAPMAAGVSRADRRDRVAWIVAGVMTIAAIVAIAAALWRPAPQPIAGAAGRFDLDDAVAGGVVSPDGASIVYQAQVGTELRWVVRTLASGATKPIPVDVETNDIFWSPDGRSLAWLSGQKLKRVDVGTGVVQTLADAPTPRGGSWGPDGTILFAPGGNGPLYRIAASGGTVAAVSELRDGDASHRHPIFLPDGRHFLFWVLGPGGIRGEYLGSLDDRRITRLFDADAPAALAAPDRVLFIREGVLYAQRLDVAGARMTGDAVTLASPFNANETAGPRASASANGVIAFRTDAVVRRQIQWVDRSGKALERIGSPVADFMVGSLSPDGQTIALTLMTHGNPFIWLMDVSRGTLSRFSNGSVPVWSPDSARLAFSSGRDGFFRMYWQRVGVSEPAELLFKSNEAQNLSDWSSNGKFIVFASQSATNARDLWLLPADGAARTPRPFLQSPAEEWNGAFSPDGKWIAYGSDEDGPSAVFVRPFPGPGRAWRVSTGAGEFPFWRSDSSEIYYFAGGQLMGVTFDGRSPTPTFGKPSTVFAAAKRSGPANRVVPLLGPTDGRRFLAATLVDDSPQRSPLTVIVNWK